MTDLRPMETPSTVPLASRVVLWLYIVFNVAIAVSLMRNPTSVDATYRGGAMTATRQFLWFSVGSFHLLVVGVTLATLRMKHAADRRWLYLANAAFYLWDALTEWGYWGARLGVASTELHRNAGISAACGLLLVWAAYLDRQAATCLHRTEPAS